MVKGGELHVQMSSEPAADSLLWTLSDSSITSGQNQSQFKVYFLSVFSFGPSLVAFIHSNVSPVVVLSLCHALSDWKRILSTTNGHRGIIVNSVAADRNGARLHTGMQTEVE